MTAPEYVGYHRDEAVAALGRLRTAWPWLADLREPGPAPHLHRYVTPRQQQIEVEQARRDRRARQVALNGGAGVDVSTSLASRGASSVPLGPHPEVARIGPIAARVDIAEHVATLAGQVWPAVYGALFSPLIADPTMRDLRDGTPCRTCGTVEACDCDATDAVVVVCLDALADTLPHLHDVHRAAEAVRILRRCDLRARRVARVVDDRRRIKAPCPACGERDLWADVSSTNEQEWSASCANPLCACRGAGCGCGRPVRYDGKRHRWPSREWHGPTGFAARLGVDLPDDQRAAA